MKTLGAVVLIALLLAPGVAFADSATDAALGLGAFAVFNQILGGVGVFSRPAPVVVAPPPVVYSPPPVVYAPPPPVYVQPQAVYVPPPPVVVYRPVPVYDKHKYRDHGRAWCPPGLARQGRCGPRWHRH